ncbi:MAG: hypothetical protein ACYC38_08840 [Eubacteriales bacterium]
MNLVKRRCDIVGAAELKAAKYHSKRAIVHSARSTITRRILHRDLCQ